MMTLTLAISDSEKYMTSLILIRIAASVLALLYVLSLKRARDLSSVNWEDLVSRLDPVRINGLRMAAYLDKRSNEALPLRDFRCLYNSIGGKEGVRRIRKNADVLIMLAAYTEVWNPGISRDAVIQMRENGFRLRNAAWKIALLSACATSSARSALLVSEFSRAYCEMLDRLLLLYAKAHISRHPMLSAACSM